MTPANVLFAMVHGAPMSSDARADELLNGYLMPQADTSDGASRPYLMLTDGVAAIPFLGCLSKYPSILRIFGFSDKPTLPELTAAVLAAGSAEEVKALFLLFDSGGGTAAGTPEAAAAVAAVAQRKPVHSYASDYCCSAAFWIASQASRVATNSIGHVGGIGTYTVLEDSSEAAAMEGLRFVLVSSGGSKGGGEDGIPVSDEYIGEVQSRIDAVNAVFLADLAPALGLSTADVKALADGHVHVGQQALDAGLVDAVESLGDALGALRAEMVSRSVPAEVDPTEVAPTDDFEDPEESPTEETKMTTETNAEKPASTGEADEERSFVRRFMDSIKALGSDQAAAVAATPAPAPALAGLNADQVNALIEAKVAARMHEQEVDADLKALSGKVPPAVLGDAEVRATLLEAKAKSSERYAAVLKVVAGNDASALLGGPVADAAHADDARVATEREAMLERHGIDAKRAADLTRTYHINDRPAVN